MEHGIATDGQYYHHPPWSTPGRAIPFIPSPVLSSLVIANIQARQQHVEDKAHST